MAQDVSKIHIPVSASITFDGVNLGFTQDGVELQNETTTEDVFADEKRKPVKRFIQNSIRGISCNLLQTELATLAKVMPGVNSSGDFDVEVSGAEIALQEGALSASWVTDEGNTLTLSIPRCTPTVGPAMKMTVRGGPIVVQNVTFRDLYNSGTHGGLSLA